MNPRLPALVLAAALLSPAARGRAAGDDDFSDPAIESRSQGLDQSLDAVRRELDAEYRDTLEFESKLKYERLRFERGLLEGRREFLQSLKSLPPDQRADAYRLFELGQQRRRREYLLEEQKRRDRFESEGERRSRRRRRETVQDYEDTQKDRDISSIQEA